MATARQTTDHDEIREWAESRGGRPAQVEGTGGMLRIDFGDQDEGLEPIEWDRFFEIFDRSGLGFLYDPEGYMNKFIQVSHDQSGIGKTEPDEKDTRSAASRGARGSRKKSTATRKKSSTGRKKSAAASRKKSSTSRKKSASGSRKKSTSVRKKSTSARKKSTSARKKSTSARKKSTSGSRKKSTATRKKSSSKKSGGRKYGRKTGKKVERAMHEMKRGQLRSGSKGPKVKSRKQAIAIGLSEARREGDKVPARRKGGRKKRR